MRGIALQCIYLFPTVKDCENQHLDPPHQCVYPAGVEFQITVEYHLHMTVAKWILPLWEQLIAKQMKKLILWHRCN